MNTLYYGDNLEILRRYIPDETVDLVYLDPPFNSNASYNVLFHDRTGGQAAAQLQAFKDTWRWEEAAPTYQELILLPGPLGDALRAFGQLLPEGGLLAYLVMMAPRLAELRRVLKPTGSLYLHCDPTASHYLKVLLDAIFGAENYVNEIIWQRTSAHSDAKQGARHFGRVHDVILLYSKSDMPTWNTLHVAHDDAYVKSHYPYVEEGTGKKYGLWDITGPGGAAKGNPYYEIFGVSKYWRYSKARMEQKIRDGLVIQPRPGAIPREKRYLDDSAGSPIGTIWNDISPINSQAAERMGYATQKPLALLKRIIEASSNPGDLVLDPFCGCGTTIAAAQELGRRWAGIDITQAAIVTIRERLSKTAQEGADYRVVGEPTTAPDAQILADSDPYQFQWWALGLVGARPAEQKKGADQGVDGRLYFTDEAEGGKVKQVILSVKAGQRISSQYVDQLIGVLEKEQAQIGVLITMREPTGPMRAAAASAGLYASPGWGQSYPRVQLLTIAELLAGKKIEMPPIGQVNVTFKKAPKSAGKKGRQGVMEL